MIFIFIDFAIRNWDFVQSVTYVMAIEVTYNKILVVIVKLTKIYFSGII